MHAAMIAWLDSLDEHRTLPMPRPLDAAMNTLLAFDTATERISIALASRAAGSGSTKRRAARRRSATLLPAVLGLLAEARISVARARRDRVRPRPRRLHRLAHRVLGGPGSRVRRRQAGAADRHACWRSPRMRAPARRARDVWVAMDARMDEIYAAQYALRGRTLGGRRRAGADDARRLNARWRDAAAASRRGQCAGGLRRRLRRGDARACAPDACAARGRHAARWRALRGRAAARSTRPRRCRSTCATRWPQTTAERDGAASGLKRERDAVAIAADERSAMSAVLRADAELRPMPWRRASMP